MSRSRAGRVRRAMLRTALIASSAFGPIAGASAQLAPRSMIAPRSEPAAAASLPRLFSPPLAVGVRSFTLTAADAAGQHRSPLAAGLLGIIPGVGHAYAGEGRRGLVVASVWLGSGMLMFSDADKSIVVVATVVNVGTYLFSITDAALAADRFNARHRP